MLPDADGGHDGAQDVVDVLVTDHHEVEQMFADLESGQGSADHRRQVADAMTAELVRHSVAEEQYLYPLARKVLPDGDRLADHEIEEHSEAERLLKRLEPLKATDPDFDATVRQIVGAVREHIREEESDLFPRLRQVCPRDELVSVGHKVQQAKKVVPTRPHPAAPNTPPMNKVLGPGAGLVDRVRDAFSHRVTSMDEVS